ncbi:hypothetical protein [Vibrio minamisatsumaniensis]|uniref:capsular polysaccharide export protein, LipB/KpsS family n=1 Tax=Vibrio minamisatsumaniensis TaxID=2910243 RepID=UPI003D1EF02B
MKQKKKVHILIDNASRLDFFQRVLNNENTTPSCVFHSNIYTYVLAKTKKHPGSHILLRQSKVKKNTAQSSIEEIKGQREYQYGINISNFKKLVEPSDELWVFSGFQYVALEIKTTHHNIRYFEIANFPNKYQSSYTGVNADADHNHKIEELRTTHTVTPREIELLKTQLLTFRPPHVDSSILSKALEQFVNLIGFHCLKTTAPHSSPLQQLQKAIEIHRVRKIIHNHKHLQRPSNFNLFIGQVAQDSQTLFQSNTNAIDSIKKAHQDSESKGLPLIVRLHPGEKQLCVIQEQTRFCKQEGILICNQGALLESVLQSEHIYTINSTGGLHSLLLEKPVTLYGNSFYQDWKASDVVLYHQHLLQELHSPNS